MLLSCHVWCFFTIFKLNILWAQFAVFVFCCPPASSKHPNFDKICLMFRYVSVKTHWAFEISRTFPVHTPYSAFVFSSSCVYGCWCEHLRLNLGTIHGQNGLVSLYINTNHNSLNDTSFSTVHMMCVIQTHQHPTCTLLCQLFNGRCQSQRSAQLRNELENAHK